GAVRTRARRAVTPACPGRSRRARCPTASRLPSRTGWTAPPPETPEGRLSRHASHRVPLPSGEALDENGRRAAFERTANAPAAGWGRLHHALSAGSIH